MLPTPDIVANPGYKIFFTLFLDKTQYKKETTIKNILRTFSDFKPKKLGISTNPNLYTRRSTPGSSDWRRRFQTRILPST